MADSTVGLHLDAGFFSLPEEGALISSLCEGSEQAYEILIERYHQPVYSLVYRLLDDPSEASDVVQEVFLKVFRKIRAFRGNSTLKTWIYRIAVNEAYNHHRWCSRHHRHAVTLDVEDSSGQAYGDHLAYSGSSPFELAANHETRVMVEAALEKLNPKFRAAVVLRDIEDLSYEDIASVLDISLGTVKSRITRGREALREILEEQQAPGTPLNWSSQPLFE